MHVQNVLVKFVEILIKYVARLVFKIAKKRHSSFFADGKRPKAAVRLLPQKNGWMLVAEYYIRTK